MFLLATHSIILYFLFSSTSVPGVTLVDYQVFPLILNYHITVKRKDYVLGVRVDTLTISTLHIYTLPIALSPIFTPSI